MMTPSTFGFILAGVLLNAGAQLLLKLGVTPLGPLSIDGATLLPTLVRVLGQWPVVAGLGCYVLSVGVWLIGLSRVDVSIAYPMLSLGYVVNAIGAWWLLGESISALRGVGMLTILFGVFLLARG